MNFLDKVKKVFRDKSFEDTPILIDGAIPTLEDFGFYIPDLIKYTVRTSNKTEAEVKKDFERLKLDNPVKPIQPINAKSDIKSIEAIQSSCIKSDMKDEDNEKIVHEVKAGRLPDIEKFWDYLKVQNRAVRTIEEYKFEYKYWIKKAEENKKTIYNLKIVHIEQILKNIKPSTVRRKIAFLKKLAKWYLREGHPKLHNEIFKFDSPKLPQRIPGDLGTKKFIELRNLAQEWCSYGKREGLWLGLMLMSGLRISEIETIELKDGNFIKVLGKGNKERIIPVPDWLFIALELHQKEGNGGWAKNRKLIWKKLNEENIKHPHNLRHTYASECLRRGKNIVEIKELLGHADISTTNIYARLNIPNDVASLLSQ